VADPKPWRTRKATAYSRSTGARVPRTVPFSLQTSTRTGCQGPPVLPIGRQRRVNKVLGRLTYHAFLHRVLVRTIVEAAQVGLAHASPAPHTGIDSTKISRKMDAQSLNTLNLTALRLCELFLETSVDPDAACRVGGGCMREPGPPNRL